MGRSRLSYDNCLLSANVSLSSVLFEFLRPRPLFQRKYILLWGEGDFRTEIAFSPLMCHFLVSFRNFLRPRPLFQRKYVLVWEEVAFRTIIAFNPVMCHFLVSLWIGGVGGSSRAAPLIAGSYGSRAPRRAPKGLEWDQGER